MGDTLNLEKALRSWWIGDDMAIKIMKNLLLMSANERVLVSTLIGVLYPNQATVTEIPDQINLILFNTDF